MRLGILCPSEIAFRRFLPALHKLDAIEYIGVAYANKEEWLGADGGVCEVSADDRIIQAEAEKAEEFLKKYGGKVFCGYKNLLESREVDAVYIPLPPALHFTWAEAALENNLHVFLEKPFTTSLKDAEHLVDAAKRRKLALHENYMFAFHSQLQEVLDAVQADEIGMVKLYRIDFGFPYRGADDFRYRRELGGGALMDCGGYTLKYADLLLDGQSEVVQADVSYMDKSDAEVFGCGVVKGRKGGIVQIAFGMDNDYRCSIDIWGSRGTIFSNRILTAPDGFVPSYTILKDGRAEVRQMKADDAFLKSIEKFIRCIENEQERIDNYESILRQQRLVEEFSRLAGIRNDA